MTRKKIKNINELFATLNMIKERLEAISFNCDKAGKSLFEKKHELYTYKAMIDKDMVNIFKINKLNAKSYQEWFNRELDYILYGNLMQNHIRNGLMGSKL